MRRALALLLALLPEGAGAQQALVVPPVSAAQIQAAVAAASPQPCGAVPPSDTLLGGVGTGTPCSPRPDMTRPTVVQAANVVTDANGLWSVSWAKAFSSATPAVNPLPINTGALPVMCNVQARTASGASGKCWQANTNTLPGTLTALGGLILNVFATGAANASVMVIAREPTQ